MSKIRAADPCRFLNDNGLRQLVVDVVSAVLDGNGAAASAAGDHRDRLAAVAAQGKQKSVQLFIVGFDPLNDVFFSDLCGQ